MKHGRFWGTFQDGKVLGITCNDCGLPARIERDRWVCRKCKTFADKPELTVTQPEAVRDGTEFRYVKFGKAWPRPRTIEEIMADAEAQTGLNPCHPGLELSSTAVSVFPAALVIEPEEMPPPELYERERERKLSRLRELLQRVVNGELLSRRENAELSDLELWNLKRLARDHV